MKTEYTFIRYVPFVGPGNGPAAGSVREDSGSRTSEPYRTEMPDGIRQGEETQRGS